MGNDQQNITLVTMSEFGRTARQNGTGGTDHGHANVMFVLGEAAYKTLGSRQLDVVFPGAKVDPRTFLNFA
jgi:uncharacterized protein (DUF1501 family)